MVKKVSNSGTDRIPSAKIGSVVDDLVSNESRKRQSFERRWYDNNFFDDGFHFRYVSRETGRIVDMNYDKSLQTPLRAVPKASRQIRGVANLLAAPQYVPVIYPEKVTIQNYPRQEMNPETGQVMYPDYMQALEVSKMQAKRIGNWLEEEYKNQELVEKTILMLILAAKHGVSYMKIYPDPVEEKLCTYVCDAFDVYLEGDLQSPYDSSFVTFTKKEYISKIKANEYFDADQVALISPDNKYASSEIKNAYMQTRYGTRMGSDQTATLIQKETYIKEYLTEYNMQKAVKDLKESSTDLKMGDQVIRQIFSAGGITLADHYVDLPEYPIVDFRYEPGPVYQVPLIERFIPANKTLDMIVSRIEGYANTMTTGIWQKRKGENVKFDNRAGGIVVEYQTTPLTQTPLVPLPGFMFNFINLLESFIEEQGASTASLNQLPPGVKSGKAIESLKATEYANLKIATLQLKKTVKTIAERMIDLASKNFIQPQTVAILQKGDPTYFDVIGERGAKVYEKIGMQQELQDTVIIKGDQRVEIEVESGLGFTEEGKKETMQQLVDYFLRLSEMGMVSPEAMKMVTQKLLEIYQYGSTQEFLDVLDKPVDQGMTEQDIMKMKVAQLEVLKEAGLVGKEAEENMVTSTKVGVVEALQDLAQGGDGDAEGFEEVTSSE